THHLLPATGDPEQVLPRKLHGLMLITVHPNHVAPALLAAVDLIVVVGAAPEETLATFSRTLGEAAPPAGAAALEAGTAIGWWHRRGAPPFLFRSIPPQAQRRPPVPKYATRGPGPDPSFYFHGPEGKLKPPAQNPTRFPQRGG